MNTNSFDRYQPHVYLNGVKLDTSPQWHGLTPLASLNIHWGAPDWYSNVDPAELTLTLIDPIGAFLDFAANDGAPIQIRRDDPVLGREGVIVFTGNVTAATTELQKIRRPDGSTHEVWALTLTALDMLGALEQDRGRGPRYYPAPGPDEGSDWHWGPCLMFERKRDLDERSPAPIIWEPTALDWLDTEGPFFYIHPVPGYETQQVVSALTVLRQTARISQVMNRPYYDPSRHVIEFIRSGMGTSSLAIGNAGQLNNIGTTHWTLDGSRFEPADGIRASTDAVEQVTTIEVVRRAMIDAGSSPRGTTTQSESRGLRDRSQMTVSYETDFGLGYDMVTTWDLMFSTVAVETYGRQNTGTLIWRLDDLTYDAQLRREATWFLNPFPPTPRFMLVNSLTNWLPSTGPFGITGGQIIFDKLGWRAELQPAAVGPSTSNFTLGNITRTVQLGNLPASRLVADLTKAGRN